MPNPFTRWLGRGSEKEPDSPAVPERRLTALEKEARAAPPGQRATPLNRAGDLCYRAGERARALAYYGRAIDTYLEDEQPEAARAVAQKIIRLHPQAVRTLCTLTWLDLAAAHGADARQHLAEYAMAAGGVDREELAREQILEMARTADDADFRRAAAEALLTLGSPDDAAEAQRLAQEGAPGRSGDALRLHCFAMAVGSNRRRGGDEGAAA